MSIQKYRANEALNVQLGQAGYVDLFTSVGAADSGFGHYIAITALKGAACTVTLTASLGASHSPDGDDDSYNTLIIPAGMTAYGSWKRVILTKGAGASASILVYRG